MKNNERIKKKEAKRKKEQTNQKVNEKGKYQNPEEMLSMLCFAYHVKDDKVSLEHQILQEHEIFLLLFKESIKNLLMPLFLMGCF